MSAQAKADRTQLTSYEMEQVQEIASWKSEPTNPLSELWKRITLPAASAIEKLIPDPLVRSTIERAYNVAEKLAKPEDIRHQAGVDDLDELRRRPLEECDRLSGQVARSALVIATIEGAVTGAGGVLTTLIDVPLLFVLSLRTVLRIGYCYGYALEGRQNRQYVLGVLVTAVSGSIETRRQRLDRLHQVEDWLIEEAQEELLMEELTSFLFQLEIFEEVPGVGAISGGLLNLAFLRRVEQTSRRAFQERWLRDNGRVDAIAPAPAHPRSLATGWTGTLGRLAHSGCYALGFGVALPVFLAAELFRPMGNVLSRTIPDGAAKASAMADGKAAPALAPA
jgi:hypothetical protein